MGVELAGTRENQHREGERGFRVVDRFEEEGRDLDDPFYRRCGDKREAVVRVGVAGRALRSRNHAGWEWRVQSTVSSGVQGLRETPLGVRRGCWSETHLGDGRDFRRVELGCEAQVQPAEDGIGRRHQKHRKNKSPATFSEK